MKNFILILSLTLLSSITSYAGSISTYDHHGNETMAFENCVINWLFLTDFAQPSQINTTCDTTPNQPIIAGFFDRKVVINGVVIQCELNDMLMQNNDNFVIRLICIDPDIIFANGFQ